MEELPFDREYVRGYLEELLTETTGNADPEVRKLLAWLADGMATTLTPGCDCSGEGQFLLMHHGLRCPYRLRCIGLPKSCHQAPAPSSTQQGEGK